MAASNSDLLQKVGLQSATTLSAPGYSAGATSITVGSTSGWPTDTGITFAMDTVTVTNGVEVQDPGSYNEFVGVVVSGTGIASVDWVDGTGDTDYVSGSTTRVYIPVSKTRENRIVTWGVVEHNQDGTHSNVTATSVTTSGNVTTTGGEVSTDTVSERSGAHGVTVDGLNIKDSKLNTNDSVVTANYTDGSILPEHLVTGSGTSWAWQSWIPSWTNLTVNNGTVTAKYIQIGKTVFYKLYLDWGSSTSVSGSVVFTLPVTSVALLGTGTPMGQFRGTGPTKNWHGPVIPNDTGSAILRWYQVSGTGVTEANLGSTSPETWDANSFYYAEGRYEAA